MSTSSAPLGRREPGGRLVEQDEARRAGERERDLELALLAVGQLGDALLLHGGQMDRLHESVGRMHQRVVCAGAQRTRSVRARRRGRRDRRCPGR